MKIFDGHNDTVTRQASDDTDWTFFERSSTGHLDVPRARESGFVGGFFAIFPGIEPDTWWPRGKSFHKEDDGSFRVDMPPELPSEVAFEMTERMFDRFELTEERSEGAFRVVRTSGELHQAIEEGALAAVAHIEGAEALGEDLRHLDHFYDRGLRSVGPVWSRSNAFGHGVPFAYPAGPDIGPGLTEAGERLVRLCDARGLVIDLSHLNEAGFWDVARITSRPLVVTHSAAHALCQKPRNLYDAQIDAVGESGGVVGITFFTGDLTASQTFEGNVPIARIVEHARYIADRIGPEHVALGSDFDGAPIPPEMRDVTGLPKLIDAFRNDGWSEAEIEQVAHANWLRILTATLPPAPAS